MPRRPLYRVGGAPDRSRPTAKYHHHDMSDERLPETPAVGSLVVMGVEGCGKTTVGQALAEALGLEFLDADTLHSMENRAKMATGEPLSDMDRLPWLRAVGARLEVARNEQRSLVVACSALRRRYRDLLREYDVAAFFLHLAGPIDVVRQRVAARHHEFASTSLLDSQYAQLEPLDADERGMTVDIRSSPDAIVNDVVAALRPPSFTN
jgi:gluconokinase